MEYVGERLAVGQVLSLTSVFPFSNIKKILHPYMPPFISAIALAIQTVVK